MHIFNNLNKSRDKNMDAEQDEKVMEDIKNGKMDVVVEEDEIIIEEIIEDVTCDCIQREPNEDSKHEKRFNEEVIDNFKQSARQIVNEKFPHFVEETKDLNLEEYWDYVLARTCIDIDLIMDDFILQLQFDFPSNKNRLSYDILKENILKMSDDFEN